MPHKLADIGKIPYAWNLPSSYGVAFPTLIGREVFVTSSEKEQLNCTNEGNVSTIRLSS
jgi:hypothetical protein